MNLYNLPLEWQQLLDDLLASDGEITKELDARMQSMVSITRESVNRAATVMRSLDVAANSAIANSEVFAMEARRLKDLSLAYQSRSARLGSLLAPILDITGKVATDVGTVYSTRKTQYTFSLAEGMTIDDLPAECVRQKSPELDKTELIRLAKSNALPNGIVVETNTKSLTILRGASKSSGSDD